MAFESILLGAPISEGIIWVSEEGTVINEITFDVVTSSPHEVNSSVPRYPVESGLEVSDNIHVNPRRLTMNGIISNTPLRFLGGLTEIVTGTTDHVQEAFDALNEIIDAETPVIAVSKLKVYPSMAIKKMTVPEDNTLDALFVTLELEEITIISDNVITQEQADLLAAQQNAGQQNAVETAANVVAQTLVLLGPLV